MTDYREHSSPRDADPDEDYDAKVAQLDDQLLRIRAARARVEQAARLLAQGDWGREASAELRLARRVLEEDQPDGT